jgi:fucose permease
MDLKERIVEKKYLLPFILITSLFALWGFALGRVGPLPAQNASFILPFISFCVIAIYGRRSYLALQS